MESRRDQLSDNISFAKKFGWSPKKGHSGGGHGGVEKSIPAEKTSAAENGIPETAVVSPSVGSVAGWPKGDVGWVGWSPKKGHSGGGHGGVEKSIPAEKTSAAENGIPETAVVSPSVGSVAGWPKGDVGWVGWSPKKGHSGGGHGGVEKSIPAEKTSAAENGIPETAVVSPSVGSVAGWPKGDVGWVGWSPKKGHSGGGHGGVEKSIPAEKTSAAENGIPETAVVSPSVGSVAGWPKGDVGWVGWSPKKGHSGGGHGGVEKSIPAEKTSAAENGIPETAVVSPSVGSVAGWPKGDVGWVGWSPKKGHSGGGHGGVEKSIPAEKTSAAENGIPETAVVSPSVGSVAGWPKGDVGWVGWSPKKGHSGGGHGGVEKSIPAEKTSAAENGIPETAVVSPSVGSVAGWPKGDVGWVGWSPKKGHSGGGHGGVEKSIPAEKTSAAENGIPETAVVSPSVGSVAGWPKGDVGWVGWSPKKGHSGGGHGGVEKSIPAEKTSAAENGIPETAVVSPSVGSVAGWPKGDVGWVGWSPKKGHSGGGHGGVEKSIPAEKTSAAENGIPETAVVSPSVGSVAGWPKGDVGWVGWSPKKGHSGGGHGGVEKSIPAEKTSAAENGIPETAVVSPSVGSVAGWPKGDVGWVGWSPKKGHSGGGHGGVEKSIPAEKTSAAENGIPETAVVSPSVGSVAGWPKGDVGWVGWSPKKGHSGGGHGGVEKSIPAEKTSAAENGIPETAVVSPSVGSVAGWPKGDVGWGGSLWKPSVTYCRPDGCSSYGL
ncbi:uncharacterized protein LOC131857902 [Cryptomeria japonica]|uniref:uncharacterized protein LOC131857902 n=1 Tax=Cryptomeria japonica TaxID=3369 RepID=UPI0027DA8181|nr:uncharacterized protein LOC131857902 [Cryptomeria japonica]